MVGVTNANKARGTRWESSVVGFLREAAGISAYKPRPEGLADVGDIHAAGFLIQAKDWADWQSAIREGLDGAVVQAGNWERKTGEALLPVAVVKRRNKAVSEAYVIVRLGDFIALMY